MSKSTLDLSGFKKIHEDKNSATLKHKDGHTLKIAKKALSPKMQEALSKLSTVKGYADGGEVIDDILLKDKGGFGNLPKIDASQMYNAKLPDAVPTPDYNTGIPADRSALKATPAELQALADRLQAEQAQKSAGATGSWSEEPVTAAAAKQAPAEQAPAAPTKMPVQKMDISEPMEITAPATAPVTLPPYNPIKTPDEVRLQMSNEDQEWQKDLANQHITPQTYSSLFAKKDTLGKIGTIFGLMVSGAGAGLTHQPNALLALMQKEIDSDLEAQKQSKANAQNFLRLNQEHQKRLAEITHLGKQGELLQAQTSAVPSQIKLTEAQAHAANTQTQITSDTLAHTQALRAAYHDLQSRVDKMPEGSPQKAAAAQQLAFIFPMVNEAITNKIDQASALQGYVQSIYGNMTGGPGKGAPGEAPAVDYGRMNQLQRMGINKIPGGMTGEDIGAATKEAQMLEESRALRADYADSFAKLSEMVLGGRLHPAQRAAYVNSLGAKLARQSAGRYNLAEAGTIVDGMFPEFGDAPETTAVKFKKGNDYFDNVDAATPTLNRYNLKIPVQAPKAETMTYKGATYQKVNGGWQKVKK
jgi:hypothetical protein